MIPPTRTFGSLVASELVAIPVDRMTAQIQPERLLLMGELLRFRPRGHIGQRHVVIGSVGWPHRLEQLRLSPLPVALEPPSVLQRPVHHGDELRSARGRLS